MSITRLVTLVIALTGLALDAHAFALRGSVIGAGATPSNGIAGGTRRMLGTVGQSAVGASGGASNIVCHGFWCFGGSRVVAVEPPVEGPALPTELAFGRPYPNPSRDQVRFELALPKSARVDLALYDLQGRRVLTVVDGELPAGYHHARWDGSGAGSVRGGSGIYFARLIVDGRPVGQHRFVVIR